MPPIRLHSTHTLRPSSPAIPHAGPLISDAGPRISTLHDPISTSTPPPAPQPEPALPGPQLWTRAWTPITPVSYLDPSRPLPLMLLGQPLVIWRHATAGWLVMSDMCPHRLAPLSEGRLEAGGTRLACAYHGWEFNQAGTCTRVPQVIVVAAVVLG